MPLYNPPLTLAVVLDSIPAGTVAAPALRPGGEAGTGFYRPAAASLGAAITGSKSFHIGLALNTSLGLGAMEGITSGTANTLVGQAVGYALTSGANNVGVGYGALRYIAGADNNVAVGNYAFFLGTGGSNVAIGSFALQSAVATNSTIAIGKQAMNAFVAPVGGSPNLAIGELALGTSTNGYANIAIGHSALQLLQDAESPFVSNLKGTGNVGIGPLALYNTTTGYENVAIGAPNVMNANTTGFLNVAIGTETLRDNTTGASNTAIGGAALQKNTTGGGNVAIGLNAGGIAADANGNVSGNNNTYLGSSTIPGSTTQRSYMTLIGAGAVGDASNTVFVGRTATDQTVLPYINAVGGLTSSFPGFKRSSAQLHARLADDSADAVFQALQINVAGTKVVGAQGATVADATDAGSAITQVNAVIARLRAHGLIAT